MYFQRIFPKLQEYLLELILISESQIILVFAALFTFFEVCGKSDGSKASLSAYVLSVYYLVIQQGAAGLGVCF